MRTPVPAHVSDNVSVCDAPDASGETPMFCELEPVKSMCVTEEFGELPAPMLLVVVVAENGTPTVADAGADIDAM